MRARESEGGERRGGSLGVKGPGRDGETQIMHIEKQCTPVTHARTRTNTHTQQGLIVCNFVINIAETELRYASGDEIHPTNQGR